MYFHDEEHGNTAMIEEVKTFPYKGAPRKQTGFRLIVSADYDEGFIYHISFFEFVQRCEYPMTLILHPSTRPGVDWQLSRIGWDGVPNGHDDFYKSDIEALYKELADYARSGVTVRACYVS